MPSREFSGIVSETFKDPNESLCAQKAFQSRSCEVLKLVSSNIPSISTATPMVDLPTAVRACLPFSPNNSTKRSDAPLITLGCSVKSAQNLQNHQASLLWSLYLSLHLPHFSIAPVTI